MAGVGGVTRGVRDWSAIVALIVRVGRGLTGDAEHIHEFQGEILSRPFALRLFALTCRRLQDSCGSRTTRKNLLITHGVTPGGVPNWTSGPHVSQSRQNVYRIPAADRSAPSDPACYTLMLLLVLASVKEEIRNSGAALNRHDITR